MEKCPDCNIELVHADYSNDPDLFTCSNSNCPSYEEEFV